MWPFCSCLFSFLHKEVYTVVKERKRKFFLEVQQHDQTETRHQEKFMYMGEETTLEEF